MRRSNDTAHLPTHSNVGVGVSSCNLFLLLSSLFSTLFVLGLITCTRVLMKHELPRQPKSISRSRPHVHLVDAPSAGSNQRASDTMLLKDLRFRHSSAQGLNVFQHGSQSDLKSIIVLPSLHAKGLKFRQRRGDAEYSNSIA
jgi:hypothetical protein